MKTKKKSGSNIKWTPEQLDKALMTAEEYMERSTIPFILLGQTLRSVMDKEQVDGEKIEIGIRKQHLTSDTLGMLKMVVDITQIHDKDNKLTKIKFRVDDVPVEVLVIHKKFKVVENPNIIWYKVTQYRIPNPVDEYWKARHFLR